MFGTDSARIVFLIAFAAAVTTVHSQPPPKPLTFEDVAPPNGYGECPCVSNWTTYGKFVQKLVIRAGLPSSYGTEGCDTYDEMREGIMFPLNCASNPAVPCMVDCKAEIPPAYCSMRWCYVDPSVCPINATYCEGYGNRIGSGKSPYCRTRKHVRSKMIVNTMTQDNTTLYSYHTCGNPDVWTEEPLRNDFDRVLRVSTIKSSPWPVGHSVGGLDPIRPELQISLDKKGAVNGALIEAFHDMVKYYFDPVPRVVIQNEGSLATKDSQGLTVKKMNSTEMYTACVIDVAVGNTDVCIGHIWHTKVREGMTTFLPAILREEVILIVPTNKTRNMGLMNSVSDWLNVPFSPFDNECWLYITIFIALAGVSVFITELKEHSEDMPFPKRGYMLLRFGRSIYLSMQGFWAGGIELKSPTIPSKMAKLGFTFFAFVTLASYIAHLSAKIATRVLSAQINTIDDVLLLRRPVCVNHMDVIGPELIAKYMGIEDLIVPSSQEDVWSKMHNEPVQCAAAIIEETLWARAQTGEFSKKDCNRGGTFWCDSMDEDGLPDPQRDCRSFTQKGDSLLSLPVAWPVASHLQTPLRKAWMSYVNNGRWQKKLKLYEGRKPLSSCEKAEKTTHAGYPLKEMYGTLIVTFTFLFVAVCLWLVEAYFGRHISAILGYPDPWLEDKQKEFQYAVKKLHGHDVPDDDAAEAVDEAPPRHEAIEFDYPNTPDNRRNQVEPENTFLGGAASTTVGQGSGLQHKPGPKEASSGEIFGMIDDIDRSHRQSTYSTT